MILGTLFERGLDPDKRAQFGAHYTDRDKIPAEFLTHVSPLGWEHINLTGEIPLARHGTRRATRNAYVGCSPPRKQPYSLGGCWRFGGFHGGSGSAFMRSFEKVSRLSPQEGMRRLSP